MNRIHLLKKLQDKTQFLTKEESDFLGPITSDELAPITGDSFVDTMINNKQKENSNVRNRNQSER